MLKKLSVQSALVRLLFAILIGTFAIYMSYFVISESRKMKTQAADTIRQNVLTASSYVDSEIDTLNTVMENIAYSNLVKEHFAEYLNRDISTPAGSYNSMQNVKVLTNLLTAIIGPNRPVDQIYLYALDRGSFGIGLDNSDSEDVVSDMSWYDKLLSSDTNKLIYCGKDDRLAKYYTYDDGSHFLTLCSVYQGTRYEPNGIIEVKRTISSLIRKLRTIDTTIYGQKLFIYDPLGNTVYSSTDSSDAAKKYALLMKHSPFGTTEKDEFISDSADYVSIPAEDGTNLFCTLSPKTGFTTLITDTNAELYAPLYSYIKSNIVIFLLILLVTLILSFAASKAFTTPIMKMYSQLQALHTADDTLASEETLAPVDSNLIELDTLYSAVINMHERAQTSMKRELTMRNQEMQSHMLALQSQMNPHFLYNSLATIQSMVDEGMDSEVIVMCQTISRILRYISSDKEPLVPIEKDLAHAKDYLDCMVMRYDEDLKYEIDIPDEMLQLMIPKLCLQLIVENSIKYSTKEVRPPWMIKIRGKMTSTFWEISIQDNGKGFAEDDLKALNQKIEYINRTDLLPSLEINGMGLMNIYIRFKTMYKGNHIFRIGNLASGGAIVTIGGEISM